MSTINPNCDGSGPHSPGELRRMPTGGGSAVSVCRDCWERELDWRRTRNESTGADAWLELPDWDSGEVCQ